MYYTRCEKEIKWSKSLAFYLFSQTRLLNSIKHEHLCKILYVKVVSKPNHTFPQGKLRLDLAVNQALGLTGMGHGAPQERAVHMATCLVKKGDSENW